MAANETRLTGRADYYVYPSCGSHSEQKGGATPVGSGHCKFNEGVGVALVQPIRWLDR